MSAYLKPDMVTEAVITAHIRENDELKKQIATAVAEWKKWAVKEAKREALLEGAEIARTAAHKLGGYQFISDKLLRMAEELK
jgi:hypothetical protein